MNKFTLLISIKSLKITDEEASKPSLIEKKNK